MERALASIFGKSNDFKVCKSCNRINFYENENLSLEFVNTDFIISALNKNKLKVKNISIKDTSDLSSFSLKWIEDIKKYI